jgi:hypothetical protein
VKRAAGQTQRGSAPALPQPPACKGGGRDRRTCGRTAEERCRLLCE